MASDNYETMSQNNLVNVNNVLTSRQLFYGPADSDFIHFIAFPPEESGAAEQLCTDDRKGDIEHLFRNQTELGRNKK